MTTGRLLLACVAMLPLPAMAVADGSYAAALSKYDLGGNSAAAEIAATASKP